MSEDRPEKLDWNTVNPGNVNLSELGFVLKKQWESQNRFLQAFSGMNTKVTAATAVGISRETVRLWEKGNQLGFKGRLEVAMETFTNRLEDKLFELALALKPGQNPMPLVVALNANLPDKYRPNAIVVDDTAKDNRAMITQFIRESKKKPDKPDELKERRG